METSKKHKIWPLIAGTIINKEVLELQSNMINNYQGGKLFRGRKYSLPVHQNEKRKVGENSKIMPQGNIKKLGGKNSMNFMMLNGDSTPHGYDDLLSYQPGNNVLNISKPSSSNSRQNMIKYPSQSKKKKSSSAQSSPNRNGLRTSKNQNVSNGLGIGISSGAINETRPYSAKNSGYARSKGYGVKNKKGEMKRSSSKKSPTSSNQEFNPVFYNKYANPNGIGLYGPGKIKIYKDKQSVSSRGSTRLNKSPNSHTANRASKNKMVGAIKLVSVNFLRICH
jgi:hypothetical protein